MAEAKITHNITVTVTDSFSSTQYFFLITVTNQPPVNSTIPSPVSLSFGQALIYNLPYSIDPEGLNFTTKVKSGPSYA